MSKNSLRKRLLSWRRKIPVTERLEASNRVVSHVVSWLAGHAHVQTVFLYAAWGSEIDVLALASAPSLSGHRFALPDARCDGSMCFRAWQAGDTLVPGLFEINVPGPQSPEVPSSGNTLVLVPAVAVDRAGGRLGYGKGFYDRWLAAHPDVVTCGVVMQDFLLDKIPSENHDHPLNWVVTENGLVALRSA